MAEVRGSGNPLRHRLEFAQNRLVALLSRADQRALRPSCERLRLEANWVIPDQVRGGQVVYLLTGASVALLDRDLKAGSPAIGLIGAEGALGLQCGLGMGFSRFTPLVQTEGTAWTISAVQFRGLLNSRPTLLMSVVRYMWTASEDLAQFSASMGRQTVMQNLASWIYRSRTRKPIDSVLLTHAHLASMLGVRRASVSFAAAALRDQGVLDYARGRIRILDSGRLQAIAQSGS